MVDESHIISNIVTPLDRIASPEQYSTYIATSGALHPVQIPALYVPAEIRPLTINQFLEFDYEILFQLNKESVRKQWGITKQPKCFEGFLKELSNTELIDENTETEVLKKYVIKDPDTFFPILKRIRLLEKYDEISKWCINFKTSQNGYEGRSGLAALHSLTFENVGVWPSDFNEIINKNYSPKLVVVEESIDRVIENISNFKSAYTLDERTTISQYAKDKGAVFIVRVGGPTLEQQYIEEILNLWKPDSVIANGDRIEDSGRPRAYILEDDQVKKWGPARSWFMNQEVIHSAYATQYPIAKELQTIDRKRLKLFCPNHYAELTPFDEDKTQLRI